MKRTKPETLYCGRRELVVEWRLCEAAEKRWVSGAPIRGPYDLAQYLEPLASRVVESLWVVHLDARMRILGHSIVTTGTLFSTTAPPAEVARAAVMGCGAAIIMAHNHPSGDGTPSPEDREASLKIQAACCAIDTPLLDSVIVVRNQDSGAVRLTSLKELGMFA